MPNYADDYLPGTWQDQLGLGTRFGTESDLLIMALAAPATHQAGPLAIVKVTHQPGRFRYRLPAGVVDFDATVKSETNEGRSYDLYIDNAGNGSCTCPDWQFRHSEDGTPCKHMKTVFGYLATVHGDEWVEV